VPNVKRETHKNTKGRGQRGKRKKKREEIKEPAEGKKAVVGLHVEKEKWSNKTSALRGVKIN